jgi:hypothetical protein
VDKLAGIITGNMSMDQKNVLALLELIQLANDDISTEDKIYRTLGTLIEIFDSDYGALFTVKGKNNRIERSYIRQKTMPGWIQEETYNEKVVDKTIKSKTGLYMVDWDNINVIDSKTGDPILHSILVVPIVMGRDVRALVYLSCPIICKEYSSNDLNFLNTLGEIIKGIIHQMPDIKD